MKGHRAKAWAIAHGAHPAKVLRGPKVSAFWLNICGNLDVVTVDTWAVRAAGITDDREAQLTLNRKGGYERVAAAYQDVAREVGVLPAELQAAVWLHVRGDKPADPETFTVRSRR
jgi:hypothetical protein